MKITIELSTRDADAIRKWASVSRTLRRSAELLGGRLDPDGATEEEVEYNLDELNDITIWLDRLHAAVREQIWLLEKE